MIVKRGDIVAWRSEPWQKLKVISDPYPYGGGDVVTAKKMAKRKADQSVGLYRVDALVPVADGFCHIGAKMDGGANNEKG